MLFFVKLIDFAATPLGLGLLLGLLGCAVAVRSRTAGLSLVGAGLIFLWIISTVWMGDWLLGTLEARFPPRPADSLRSADAIVALGGGVSPAAAPRVYPNLHEGADRLWHAARLYHAGVAPVVIVSGGNPPGRVAPTAPAMKTLMASWNVPPDSVLLESKSNTTHGNAVYTARLCEKRGIDRVVLVTSASHMRRAVATFRTTDVTVIPAATDYRVVQRPVSLLSVVPDVEGLFNSTTAFHEYVGYVYYRWRGWIE